MRITKILCRQHIGKQFVKHWMVQGKRTAVDTGAEKILASKNIPVFKPEDILREPLKPKVEVVGFARKKVAFDETHPDWKNRVCHTYGDNNVLLEGLDQAKIITKSVSPKSGLPENIKLKNCSKAVDEAARRIILYSHLFDAEQQKLPKLKDPLRPAWNFPRVYGITENRKNMLILSKLLQLVEQESYSQVVKQRAIFNDLMFSFPFEKSGDLIQLNLKADTILTSSKPLSPIYKGTTQSFEIPNLFPIKETITLEKQNIYNLQNIYPINNKLTKSHPHTIFIHYNTTEVANIYEEEVTESQIYGRSLLKTFTVAASYARSIYGENVKLLPKPITVQCVHTDGRLFHFGLFQLNTLDLDNQDSEKNIWYQLDRIPLFSSCSYNLGKPTLEDFNNEVVKYLLAFYENE